MGAFDHLEWTYNGAFEQLFGHGRGTFGQKFPKIQMGLPRGGGGGVFKIRLDWYISADFFLCLEGPSNACFVSFSFHFCVQFFDFLVTCLLDFQ